MADRRTNLNQGAQAIDRKRTGRTVCLKFQGIPPHHPPWPIQSPTPPLSCTPCPTACPRARTSPPLRRTRRCTRGCVRRAALARGVPPSSISWWRCGACGHLPRPSPARAQSLADGDGFWRDMATQHLVWDKPFDSVMGGGFRLGDVNWFAGGRLNVSVNCVDRHLSTKGDQVSTFPRACPVANRCRIPHPRRVCICHCVSVWLRTSACLSALVCVCAPTCV